MAEQQQQPTQEKEEKATEEAEAEAGEGGDKQLSKSALKKLAAKQKQAERRAAGKAAAASQKKQQPQPESSQPAPSASSSSSSSATAAPSADSEAGAENFGAEALNMSQGRPGVVYTAVRDLCETHVGAEVHILGRVHALRTKGNVVFVLVRQGIASVQCVVEKRPGTVPKSALKFAAGLAAESIVRVAGKVAKANVDKATQKTVEIMANSLKLVSAAETPLPVQLEDMARPQELIRAQKKAIAEIEGRIEMIRKGKTEEELSKSPLKEQLEAIAAELVAAHKFVKVKQDTRLNYRVLDLRTPANQAIFRLQSAVCQLFRDYLTSEKFVEIHTPKLIGCASEGGANVFQVQYFKTHAYLAQSPQLYKQMAVVGDLERVFEIGPVFRAEDSNTHRHLTEFVGLDIEMSLREHYHEALDVLRGLFTAIFSGLETCFSAEIDAVSQQFPVQKLVYDPIAVLPFPEAVEMLKSDGQKMGDYDDLTTTLEIRLGQLVKAKYHTDVFILDTFPAAVRPFYTMPDPASPAYSNSYDIFLRGQEICSGAQRIHDPVLLTQRALAKGVAPDSIRAYIDSFKWGAPPHAGAGIGLERVVMLYLGLSNIRKTSMFPRDPSRLSP
jgi:aspartyl-tRNA synthetase